MKPFESQSEKRAARKLTTLLLLLAVAICLIPLTEPAYAAGSVPWRFGRSKNTEPEPRSPYNAFIDDYESFEVTSTSLNQGVWDDIISNTSKGANRSPQLKWSPVDGAGLYVIIMDDPDAKDWMHWKSDHVTETSLDEGWASSSDYIGPYPPSGSTHTYEVYVIALKAPVERVKGAFNGQNPKFEENFQTLDTDADGNSGNIIAVGRISGTFTH